jgi:hypothetical protein
MGWRSIGFQCTGLFIQPDADYAGEQGILENVIVVK